MIRAHRKALEAMAPAGLTLFVSKVPEGVALPSRYAVLHFTSGEAASSSYSRGVSDFRRWPFVTHAYGKDAEQCQWVQEQLEDAYLDKRPAIPGRQCTPIERVGAGIPPEPDNDETPPIVLARDSWAFVSLPA